ncbi:peptidylprolyl isomerase [Pelagibius sp. Alg239-R121]|uniref:peptidylprolyl isomerase n=1 Tax=Pelagibius sp. Alg239-R121 TaxID=2993448 RepID=UPI0024A75DBA|nr:peptidylprolyl isomerase [Pelagibius sp. Alg239-R121]
MDMAYSGIDVMKFFRLRLSLALLLLLASGMTAAAQDMLRPAAVVNDEVISILDLTQRARLTLLATRQKDGPETRRRLIPQVLRRLVDERLQMQEAQRLEISVADNQVEAALADLARQNKMSRDQFVSFLRRKGVLASTISDQIRAQIAWSIVVARRLRPSVNISDEEVQEVVDRVATGVNSAQRRVGEIFLAVENAQREAEVRENALRLLNRLREGANFGTLAREFSQSASASLGGDLGWVAQGELQPELDQALASAAPNSVVGPIQTTTGFYLLNFLEQRQAGQEETLNLKQVLFALPATPTSEQIEGARARAAGARAQLTSCEAVDDVAAAIGSPGSGDLGTVKTSELPAELRTAVQNLATGEASQPVQVSGGISVLLVCSRTGSDQGVDRARIVTTLTNQRLDVLAQRYLQDLRRTANVDIRI